MYHHNYIIIITVGEASPKGQKTCASCPAAPPPQIATIGEKLQFNELQGMITCSYILLIQMLLQPSRIYQC